MSEATQTALFHQSTVLHARLIVSEPFKLHVLLSQSLVNMAAPMSVYSGLAITPCKYSECQSWGLVI